MADKIGTSLDGDIDEDVWEEEEWSAGTISCSDSTWNADRDSGGGGRAIWFQGGHRIVNVIAEGSEADWLGRGHFFFRRFLLDNSDTINKQLLKDNYSFTSSPLYPTRSSNGFAESWLNNRFIISSFPVWNAISILDCPNSFFYSSFILHTTTSNTSAFGIDDKMDLITSICCKRVARSIVKEESMMIRSGVFPESFLFKMAPCWIRKSTHWLKSDTEREYEHVSICRSIM